MASIRQRHGYAVKNAERVGTFTLKAKDEDGYSETIKLVARPDIGTNGVTQAAVRAAAHKGGGEVGYSAPCGAHDAQDKGILMLGPKLATLIDSANETDTAEKPRKGAKEREQAAETATV